MSTRAAIYGIDPGPERSALVGITAGERVLIVERHFEPNAVLSRLLGLLVGSGVLAVEWVTSYGSDTPQSIFHTARWIGRFEAAWGEDAILLTRATIRAHLTGRARGGDPEVRRALLERVGGRGTKRAPGPTHGIAGHLWAALAVAVVAADRIAEAPRISSDARSALDPYRG